MKNNGLEQIRMGKNVKEREKQERMSKNVSKTEVVGKNRKE